MKSDFAFKHMDTSEAVIDHATQGTHKLEKFEMKPTHAHWVFSVQRHEHFAEVILKGPQIHFQASAISDDMYKSIDMALERLGRQLAKKKAIVQNHKHPELEVDLDKLDSEDKVGS